MHFTFASAEALSAPSSSPAELVVVRRRRRRPGVKRELLVLWSLSGFIGELTHSWAGVNESMESARVNLVELISSWISSEYRTQLKAGLRNRYVYRLPRFVEPSIGLERQQNPRRKKTCIQPTDKRNSECVTPTLESSSICLPKSGSIWHKKRAHNETN